MKAFISHDTALEYWRAHFPLDSDLGSPARASSAQECATKKADVLGCVPETLIVPGKPVEVLVFDGSSCFVTKTVKRHLWSSAVPKKAFYRVGLMMVSSPEFVFLQMAQKLSVAQLVALGCELCGYYVLNRNDVGFQASPDACPTRVTPLTNLDKLHAFVESASGAQGRQKAARALKYVIEGSR